MEASSANQLIVEGKDDLYFVVNLLKAYGVTWPESSRNRPIHVTDFQGKDNILDAQKLAKAFEDLLYVAGNEEGVRNLGILLDADTNAASKFESLRTLLSLYKLPPQLPIGGLIHGTEKLRIGIWIMPDNLNPGNLESLLQTLIPANSKLLWRHAVSATEAATAVGSQFRPVDQAKAELHTWLAWQDPPGRPYGTAIEARMLEVPNSSAAAFAKWLNDLYDLKINFT